MSGELIEVPNTSVSVMRDPVEVLKEAKKAAQSLMTVVAQKRKPVIINGEQYLEFEDWQTLARFYGLTVRILNTQLVDIGGIQGYEAKAEVIRSTDGCVVSSAESMCLNDEKMWKDRPLFQLRSMAQTRSCAKALRNVLAWVAVLGGFKPTPAEEMDGVTRKTTKPDVTPPQAKSESTGDGISVPQQKRFYAIARGSGKTDDDIKEWLMFNYNLGSTKEIPRKIYDEVCMKVGKSE